MPHLYWAVHCNTPGCNTETIIGYQNIYVVDTRVVPLLTGMNPNPIRVRCAKCDQAYEYDVAEVVGKFSDDPPPLGYRPLISARFLGGI